MRISTIGAAITLTAAITAIPSTACAASPGGGQSAQSGPLSHAASAADQYCTTLVEKIPGEHGKSRVVSSSCSTDPHSPSLLADRGALLVVFYRDADYKGPSQSVYGKNGQCDAEGYGLSDLSGVHYKVGGISSYTVSDQCNEQRYYNGLYFGGDWRTNIFSQNYVGDPWNDNLWSMQLWNGLNN